MKIIDLCNYLKKTNTMNKLRARYDKDTAVSESTWDISLLSCGAVINAVD